MGSKLASSNVDDEKLFIKRLEKQRSLYSMSTQPDLSKETNCAEFREKVHSCLSQTFDYDHSGCPVYNSLRECVKKITKKEVTSTMSFMIWEKELYSSFKDTRTKSFIPFKAEIYELTKVLTKKGKDFIFYKFISVFDQAIFNEHEKEVINIFLNCQGVSQVGRQKV